MLAADILMGIQALYEFPKLRELHSNPTSVLG